MAAADATLAAVERLRRLAADLASGGGDHRWLASCLGHYLEMAPTGRNLNRPAARHMWVEQSMHCATYGLQLASALRCVWVARHRLAHHTIQPTSGDAILPQRSFRLTDATLADLDRIARHLSAIDGRPPNQTTALAWAIARGADAVDAAEAKAKPTGSAPSAQLRHIQQQLSDITKAIWDDASGATPTFGTPALARDDVPPGLAAPGRRAPSVCI
jgi:hypothetical protein